MDENASAKYSTVGDPDAPGSADIPGEWELNEDGVTYNLVNARGIVDVYNDARADPTDTSCCSSHYCVPSLNIEIGDSKHCGFDAARSKPKRRRYSLGPNSDKSYLDAGKNTMARPCPLTEAGDSESFKWHRDGSYDVLAECGPYKLEVTYNHLGVAKCEELVRLAQEGGRDRQFVGKNLWAQLAFGYAGLGSSAYSGKGFCAHPANAQVVIDNADGGKTCLDFLEDQDAMVRWCEQGNNQEKVDCQCVNLFRDNGDLCADTANKELPGCKEIWAAWEEVGGTPSGSASTANIPPSCLVGAVCSQAKLQPAQYEPCPIKNFNLCAQINKSDNVTTDGGMEVYNTCNQQADSEEITSSVTAGTPASTAYDWDSSAKDGDGDGEGEGDSEGGDGWWAKQSDENKMMYGAGAVFVIIILIMMAMMMGGKKGGGYPMMPY